MNDRFQIVGRRERRAEISEHKAKWYVEKPIGSFLILAILLTGCFGCKLIMTKNPFYMDFLNGNVPPSREFLFGTDTMGRDIFSMIWYGGRSSLFIGLVAAAISTGVAIIIGSISGYGSARLDFVLMRATEIIISIPNILLVVMIQAFLGKSTVITIAFVIGMTSWMSIAKVVRSEVRQIRNSDYVTASRCMGAGFGHLLWYHLTPNFFSAIMFMVVMNIRTAIITESTLSFMGIGLPLETVSWGSMLSLADKALLTNSWWIIWIPGAFLVMTMLCITNIGNYLRKRMNKNMAVMLSS